MTNIRETIARELHKPARRNFPRRAVVLKGLNDLYQADLVEVIPHAKVNKGMKYILTVIDCFTKVAHAVAMKNKTAEAVVTAIEPILKKNKMRLLQTDQGKEYYNNRFASLMKKYRIIHYSVYNELKASIIERFNRTLKEMMYRMFSETGTYVWIDRLSELIRVYNNRYHNTIGMKPKDVNKNNELEVLKRIKSNTGPRSASQKTTRLILKGDKVRISKYKRVFAKGYLPNWTNEVFTVVTVQPTLPPTYILKDSNGEILSGAFYGYEVAKSTVGNVYLIEKVLRRKGNKYLVRWLGFDRTHDSWIDKQDLV